MAIKPSQGVLSKTKVGITQRCPVWVVTTYNITTTETVFPFSVSVFSLPYV